MQSAEMEAFDKMNGAVDQHQSRLMLVETQSSWCSLRERNDRVRKGLLASDQELPLLKKIPT